MLSYRSILSSARRRKSRPSAIAYIPDIKDEIHLTKDWTFTIHAEYRNEQFFKLDGFMEYRDVTHWKSPNYKTTHYQRTLPAGSILVIDRIYIRQGSKKYSSVTLYLKETSDPILKKTKGNKYIVRFWVKLHDFNGAEAELTK